ncbi:MAG: HAMP domain-containing histidine kinase [Pelomonas sp.]|nr:HAMP domain-containing histidine kinase [Roseateles sp.]MBV8469634.1 HAMP domain-containing histidine kinase [Burkholderiaceae bacterium]MBV8603793.1 HAMP domain-containing histidine kinase [Roseateles sp.]
MSAPSPQAWPATPANFESRYGHQNMLQLIQLRWFAVAGQIFTIVVVSLGLGVRLPLPEMLEVLACLTAFNIASQLRWHERPSVSNNEIFVALLVDVATLTAQLYLSGGVTNPFLFLYLLQVILGAVLLKPWSTWTIVALTSACVAGLDLFSRPMDLPPDHEQGLASLYIQGLLICFALNATLLVVFVTRIHKNLRERDAKLADLRQHANEAEHIVRMGLLASGAAHELGTPLSTLAVILGDWQHMAPFKADPDLGQELAEMQAQVQRCKRIVSGILLSAGEARGESSEATTVREFLDGLVQKWRETRAVQSLVYENRFGEDLPMVSDSTIQQMICNVLDNALEASPQALCLEVEREAGPAGELLLLTVSDEGPGFAPDILGQVGKPYLSTKGRAGGGLGLFLVVNVARTLGGTVQARNLPEGGAQVRIRLPLAVIRFDLQPQESGHVH